MRPCGLALLLVSMSVVASAADIAGVKLDDRTTLGTSELVLNGAGLNKRVFFKVAPVSRERCSAGGTDESLGLVP